MERQPSTYGQGVCVSRVFDLLSYTLSSIFSFQSRYVCRITLIRLQSFLSISCGVLDPCPRHFTIGPLQRFLPMWLAFSNHAYYQEIYRSFSLFVLMNTQTKSAATDFMDLPDNDRAILLHETIPHGIGTLIQASKFPPILPSVAHSNMITKTTAFTANSSLR